MPLYLGEDPVQALHMGSTAVKQLWKGSTLLWSRSTLRDDFDRDDGPLGSNWTDGGPSVDYFAEIAGGQLRLEIEDGLIPVTIRTSRQRFNASVAPGDDYELEFRVGSQGSGANVLGDEHWTRVYARLSDSAFTHGVAVQLLNSQLSIWRRVAGTDTPMAPDCGEFAAGDLIRMRGAGNLHTVIRNGDEVGNWNDASATASSGSGFRSLGVEVRASRDFRRLFSPSIDYVELR